MKLSEYLAASAAVADVVATGERTGSQMVLAVDCSENGNADIADYAVVAAHIENQGAALSPTTTDKEYIHEGPTTVKSSTKRTFSVTGQLLRGDEFHDFIASHKIKYGKGNTVQRKYVYFDPGTGKGECGDVIIIVNNDGAAAAGVAADIDVALNAVGTPSEYTHEELETDMPEDVSGGSTQGGNGE